jgi:hypothetical protein
MVSPDAELFSMGYGALGQLGNGSLDNKW